MVTPRSALFSLDMGLLFTGIAIGPALGGLIIRFTGRFIIVFYISTAIHVVYSLLIWFVIPESLSPSDMQAARSRHKHDLEEYRARVRGKAYNSAVMVDPSGAVVKVFRKHFLYKADTPWADEGAGFEYVDVPALGRIAVGICMDLNRTLLRRRRPDASLPSLWRLPKIRAHPLL